MSNRDEPLPSPLPLPLHAESGCVCGSDGLVLALVLLYPGRPDGCNALALTHERAAAIAAACNEAAALKRRIAELEAERAELRKCLRGIALKPTTNESANEDEAHGYRDFRGAYNIMIREARRVMKEKL